MTDDLIAAADLLEKLGKETATVGHGEDCDRLGHDDCGDVPGEGWHCEQGDTYEECHSWECGCGADRLRNLATQALAFASRIPRSKPA